MTQKYGVNMSSDDLPQKYEHPDLETFKRGADGDYQTLIRNRGKRYDLILNVAHLENCKVLPALDKSADMFSKYFADAPARISQCKQAISNRFLTVANVYSAQVQQTSITERAFLRMIQLKGITVHPRGCSYWFEDGNTLGGHGIVVSFGPRGGLIDDPWLIG